jgi:diguanylate cyclase (GGDEF)-like protein
LPEPGRPRRPRSNQHLPFTRHRHPLDHIAGGSRAPEPPEPAATPPRRATRPWRWQALGVVAAAVLAAYLPTPAAGTSFHGLWAATLAALADFFAAALLLHRHRTRTAGVPFSVAALLIAGLGVYVTGGAHSYEASLPFVMFFLVSATYPPRTSLVLGALTAAVVIAVNLLGGDAAFGWHSLLFQVPAILLIGQYASLLYIDLNREWRQKQRLAEIAAAGRDLAALDTASAMAALTHHLRRLTRADEVAVFLRDGMDLACAALWIGPAFARADRQPPPAEGLRVGQGLVGWAAAHRRSALVSDTRVDPRIQAPPPLGREPIACAVVPLLARRPRELERSDPWRPGASAASGQGDDAVADGTVGEPEAPVPAEVEARGAIGPPKAPVPAEGETLGAIGPPKAPAPAPAEGETDGASVPPEAPVPGEAAAEMATGRPKGSVPAEPGEEVVGVIRIARLGVGSLDAEDVDSAEVLAAQAALAIANARLFEQVRRQSLVDATTGLFNARYLAMRLDEELARAQRRNRPLALGFIDSDSLKKVNDRLGHQRGDELVREIAAQIRASVRSEDVPVRYAGDEFIVIMPDTPVAAAEGVLERVRAAVAGASAAFEGLATTVSVGVAGFPEHANSAEDLIRLADNAMYAAKAAGKNRVAVWSGV